MTDLPTPPKGRRWLNSTKELWHAWHQPHGLAEEVTPADRLQLPTLLTLHDDLARATSPTSRVRLSNEVRQFTKRLTRKPRKERREWERAEGPSPENLKWQREVWRGLTLTPAEELAPLWAE